ncbi:TRAP transporter small permease subunit [bacterium]|nr:TRAP transporter small permease subunit [candidate division CSSED10-310 bacterium]
MTSRYIFVKKIISWLHRLENGFLAFLLGIMVLLAFLQIIDRLLLNGRIFVTLGFDWSDDVINHLILFVTMVGAAIATRNREHITIDIVNRFVQPKTRSVIRAITDFFSAAICTFLVIAAIKYVKIMAFLNIENVGPFPSWPFQLILPVVFTIITIRFSIQTVSDILTFIKPSDKT